MGAITKQDQLKWNKPKKKAKWSRKKLQETPFNDLPKYQQKKMIDKLIRECDALFSKIVRTRDGRCLHGGNFLFGTECKGGLECAHMIERENYAFRWDFRNALTLCNKHHKYGWHLYPTQYHLWLKEAHPDVSEFMETNVFKGTYAKPSYESLIKIKEELEWKLNSVS